MLEIAGKAMYICLYLPLDRTWHNVKWPEGQIIVGIRGGEGQARAEARTLLVIGPISAMRAWWA